MKLHKAVEKITRMAAAEREDQRLERTHNPKLAKERGNRAAAMEALIAECSKPRPSVGIVRCFWVNPLDLKWSGTTLLRCFSQKNNSEAQAAITPVLVVKDTQAARRALDLK